MKKGYIFDMDGTLLDSLEAWVDVGNSYLRSIGIKEDPELDSIMKDMSLNEGGLYMKERYHLSQSVEEIIKGACHIVENKYIYEIQLNVGVQSFLEKCYEQGYVMCVLTASSSKLAKKALKRLGILDYFQDVYSCQTIGYSKKDQRVYLETMKKLGVHQSECVVVEDALYAIETAVKAGFHVKAIQNKENQKDWSKICQIADESYESFDEMQVKIES